MPFLSPVEIATILQAVLGVLVLATLLLVQRRSSGLRKAVVLGPARPNRLTGAHLIVVLLASFAAANLLATAIGCLFDKPRHRPAAASPQAWPAWRGVGPASATARPQPACASTSAAVATRPEKSASRHEQLTNLAAMALTEAMMIVVILWLASRTFAGGLRGFGLDRRRLGTDFLWAVVGYLAFFPVAMLAAAGTIQVAEWLRPQWRPVEHSVVSLLKAAELGFAWRCLLWIVAGLLAPIFEELFFRGLLQSWFRSTTGKAWFAICACGFSFGFVHAHQWQDVPTLVALGITLGFAYERSGSLALAIVFHCLFNFRTLLVLALAGSAV